MSDNVFKFYPKDAAMKADNVLEQAIGQYEEVLILGYDGQGVLDPRATLTLTAAEILFIMEFFKNKLLNGDYSDE